MTQVKYHGFAAGERKKSPASVTTLAFPNETASLLLSIQRAAAPTRAARMMPASARLRMRPKSPSFTCHSKANRVKPSKSNRPAPKKGR